VRVAGLDLSLTGTGIAQVNDSGDVSTELVKSTGKKDFTLAQTADRIGLVAGTTLNHIHSNVELAVVEAPSYGSSGGAAHERAGLWWEIVRGLRQRSIKVVTVAPTTLKVYACGTSKVDKDEVLAAVIRTYLQVNVRNNNVADAVVLAAMGARFLGFPIDSLPDTKTRAMKTPKWAA
jgi:crossover junction endodeoxyribonuclease RuvC